LNRLADRAISWPLAGRSIEKEANNNKILAKREPGFRLKRDVSALAYGLIDKSFDGGLAEIVDTGEFHSAQPAVRGPLDMQDTGVDMAALVAH
jgi:hypothetical protein